MTVKRCFSVSLICRANASRDSSSFLTKFCSPTAGTPFFSASGTPPLGMSLRSYFLCSALLSSSRPSSIWLSNTSSNMTVKRCFSVSLICRANASRDSSSFLTKFCSPTAGTPFFSASGTPPLGMSLRSYFLCSALLSSSRPSSIWLRNTSSNMTVKRCFSVSRIRRANASRDSSSFLTKFCLPTAGTPFFSMDVSILL